MSEQDNQTVGIASCPRASFLPAPFGIAFCLQNRKMETPQDFPPTSEGSNASDSDEGTVSNSSDEGTVEYRKQMMNRIKRFYCPIEQISGIQNDYIRYLEMEESEFLEQMVENEFTRNLVQSMFELARSKLTFDDKCEASLVMMITRDLARRAERCCELAKEVTKVEYKELDVIDKVENEIRTFMLLLEPFNLTDDDIKENPKLEFSHYQNITFQLRKVTKARGDVFLFKETIKKQLKEQQSVQIKDANYNLAEKDCKKAASGTVESDQMGDVHVGVAILAASPVPVSLTDQTKIKRLDSNCNEASNSDGRKRARPSK